MIGRLPYTALRDAILAHPTLAEGLETLFSSEPTTLKPQHESPLARRAGSSVPT
jgi:hypothetical protein